MKIKCDECGKVFRPGNNAEGLPNGLGFQLKDGTVWNMCRECICEIGEGTRTSKKGVKPSES